MSINVHIKGDRSFFKSKNAVTRFKSDLKKSDVSVHLEASNYFLESCNYKLEVKECDYHVSLIKEVVNLKKKNIRKKYQERMKGLKNNRNNNMGKKVKNMKKEVPKGLFNSFMKLKKIMPNLPVDSPDEILSNPEKHMDTFKKIAENISPNDLNSGDPYKTYLVKMIKELGLEESLGAKKKVIPEVPKDLKFEVLDQFKELECDKSKFIASEKFDGVKENYVFKMGSHGLGYYPDKMNDLSID
tara:strand:- start:133 stop:861 length:729 start_codon:yes stop_codon:yes gene_type:complete